MAKELARRIRHFIEDPAAGSFEDLALQAFAWQLERVPGLAGLAGPAGRPARAGRTGPVGPAGGNWRSLPAVPALAYKSLDLTPRGLDVSEAPVFRSSGTTGGARSVHRHAFPGLYRAAVDASFPRHCLPGGGRPGRPRHLPILSLVPPLADLPDSSLSFMIDHVVHRHGAAGSAWAFGPDGLDAAAADAWATARRRDGRPGLIATTALALAAWLDELEAAGRTHRLPAGTVIFETGGFKGRRRELSRADLLDRIEALLGVAPGRVVREYGMTELTSQLYTRTLDGGDPDLFTAPHWVRVRVLDPATLEEAPPGATGLVTVFDLANLSSAVHLMTEDLGALEPGGLRLQGRAAGAELRGCSLAAEEMMEAETDG
jgi:hypothetical protein